MPALPEAPSRGAAVRFAAELAAYGDDLAIVTREEEISYRELARRVDETARALGDERRLVLVTGANEVEPLVAYLAALSAGHPVLLVPGDNPRTVPELVAAYDPDVVVGRRDGRWSLDERRPGSAHRLHPELALLLTTSGSTGSPKLVRLSQENVQANAAAIAGYLGIRRTDRAATTLPMHYCYGLSVVNSHLLRGAAVILTDLSVVDTCFWDLFRRARGTTFAGVPYTFDLLDRVGFAGMHLPHLRYVTQAGGRLAPERVRGYAEVGQRQGWDLFVMYGQTEATARMAYLPPDLALSHPGAIGVPIPGGSFALEPLPDSTDPDTGELVYAGPNVMLGYAEAPGDLALGRTVHVLRTGDIARRGADGLYEVVGRRSRFVKLFGLRIDLQHAEAVLARHGLTTCCAGVEDELVVALEGAHDVLAVRRRVAEEFGLAPGAVRVLCLDRIPLLPSGKPDYVAVRELARADREAVEVRPGIAASPVDRAALRALFATALDRTDVTDDSSFVSLGGDSLTYVNMSLLLEEALGHLPRGWHTTPIRELAPAATRRRRSRGRSVETGVLLRALAVVLIAGTHAALFALPGTAHLLIALAGFNFARFQLTAAPRRDRVRNQLASIGRIAVPTVAWVAVAATLGGPYGIANLTLLNAVVGAETWDSRWHFWFVEVLVYVLLGLAALLAIPAVDRAERRHPFWFPALLVPVGLLARYGVVDFGILHTRPVFWLFALGWTAARATTTWQRLCVTAVVGLTVPGFFADSTRKAIATGGLLLLLWVPRVRCPLALTRVVGLLASSSLYVYLVQWQVFPHLDDAQPLLAVVASIAAGVLYWLAVTRVQRQLDRVRASRRRRRARRAARRSCAAARRPSCSRRSARAGSPPLRRP